MQVLARAPGKLVITGEYAVLEGAPALVMAVDRQAQVSLQSADDGDYRISAPGLGIYAARGRLEADGSLRWPALDAATAKQLALVSAVVETLAEEIPSTPFHASLDTRAFRTAAGNAKLGLGSSAALTVALGRAIRAHDRQAAPDVDTLIAAHRRAQSGRGSGLDIAASHAGGLLNFRLQDGHACITPAAWPAGLLWCCVWSGKSASTATYLAQLAAWRTREPARYAALMRELGECAGAAAAADRAGAMLESVAAYARALERLAQASGLDIVCAEHRQLAALAVRHDVIYKTCGAGGGDIGIALATEAEQLHAFRHAAHAAGFSVLELQPATAASVACTDS